MSLLHPGQCDSREPTARFSVPVVTDTCGSVCTIRIVTTLLRIASAQES